LQRRAAGESASSRPDLTTVPAAQIGRPDPRREQARVGRGMVAGERPARSSQRAMKHPLRLPGGLIVGPPGAH
jgi:hypothetical protein